MKIFICIGHFAALVSAAAATCDVMLQADEFSVASASNAPSVGTHFHSNNGGSFDNPIDLMEIGEYSDRGIEEVRGMAEFDVMGQPKAKDAELYCIVDRRGGLFSGNNDFTNPDFNIDILAYEGNYQEDITDYEIAMISMVGSFNTADFDVNDVVGPFDVKSVYNGVLASGNSLGIRMQTEDDTSGGAFTLGVCTLCLIQKKGQSTRSPAMLSPQNSNEREGPSKQEAFFSHGGEGGGGGIRMMMKKKDNAPPEIL